MPILDNNGNKPKLYVGDRHPVNLYKGDVKVGGWKEETKSGESIVFTDTYNDTAEVEFQGNSVQLADKYREVSGTNLTIDSTLHDKTTADKLVIGGTTVQKSDYYAKDGLITQSSNYFAKDGLSSQYVDTKTMGKNLVDDVLGTSIHIGAPTVVDNGNYLTVTTTSNAMGVAYIPPKKLALTTQYNFAIDVEVVSSDVPAAGIAVRVWNKTKVGYITSGLTTGAFVASGRVRLSGTFNTNTGVGMSDGDVVEFWVCQSGTATNVVYKVYKGTVQLELGSTATAFEPYKDTVKSGLVMELSGRNFFNDPATTTLQDRSGNGNVGTASGFQYRTTEYADRTADFAGKVSGSVVENANISKATYMNSNYTSLLIPSAGSWSEINGNGTAYSSISTLNGTIYSSTTNINGAISQQLFSFNVIAEFEKAYGAVPSADQTLVGKVAWLRSNLLALHMKWHGYGSCPTGNKANFQIYYNGGWNGTPRTHTSSSVAMLSDEVSLVSSFLNSDGFIHGIAYTDASDGVTASTIYTDYVSLTLKFKPASGSDGTGGIKFDGIDDYISVANNSNLNLTQTGGTVSAWYKNTATLTGSLGGSILGKSTGYGSGYWLRQVGMKVTFSLWGNTTSELTSTSNINNGSWHHILATWDSTSLKLYIDGVFDKSISTPTSLTTSAANPLFIGKHIISGELFNAGSISQVQVYNKALSASEVYQNYMAGTSLNLPAPTDPSPITSNLPAKTYKYTDGSDIYEFTLPEELRGIGTAVDKVVFDRVSKKAFVERRVGKKVFNGTENWVFLTSGGAVAGYTSCGVVITGYLKNLGNNTLISDKLKSNIGRSEANEGIYIVDTYYNYSGPIVRIKNERLGTPDIAGFKSWLALSNLTCYFHLETVTSTPITFTKVTSSPYTEVPMTFLTATPDPLHPADLYSNLPTGSYKYTSTDGVYEFTLTGDELRGIGTAVDKVVFDRVSKVAYLERRIGKRVIMGTEELFNGGGLYEGVNGTARGILFRENLLDCTSIDGHSKVSHFIYGGAVWSSDNSTDMYGWSGYDRIYIRLSNSLLGISASDNSDTKSTKFRAWLTTQYNQGTPVIVYSTLLKVTRTPLTFAKVTSSTKTEVPMTFLTNTPSLDYPASVLSVNSGSKVLVHGKNLIDLSKFQIRGVNTLLSISGNSITITDDYYSRINVKVKRNTNYYIQAVRDNQPNGGSIAVYARDISSQYMIHFMNNGNYSFNSGDNDEVFLLFYSSGGTVMSKTFTNVQLEEGSVATAYEPFKGYQETTIPVTLKSIG